MHGQCMVCNGCMHESSTYRYFLWAPVFSEEGLAWPVYGAAAWEDNCSCWCIWIWKEYLREAWLSKMNPDLYQGLGDRFLLIKNVVKWSMSMRWQICLIWYRSRGSWFSDIMIPWKVQSWSMECLWKTGTWPICIDIWWLAQLYVGRGSAPGS